MACGQEIVPRRSVKNTRGTRYLEGTISEPSFVARRDQYEAHLRDHIPPADTEPAELTNIQICALIGQYLLTRFDEQHGYVNSADSLMENAQFHYGNFVMAWGDFSTALGLQPKTFGQE